MGNGAPVAMRREGVPFSYQKHVKELAFIAFVECDRNITRAHRWLLEHAEDEEYLPDRSTLSRWAKHEAWDALATQAIADSYPALRAELLARVLVNAKLAVAFDHALQRGELGHVRPGELMAMVQTSTINKSLAGIGTAGSRAEEVKMGTTVRTPLAALPDALTPIEIARRNRKHIEDQQ